MARQLPLLSLLVSAFCSAAVAGSVGAASRGSLFDRLGGNPAITAFVSDGVDQAAANPQLRAALGAADLTELKTRLARHICALTGGGCRASGEDPQLPQLIDALRSAMREHQVPLAARNELLEILTPARREVARL